jgi:hypothetical protein
VVDADCGWVKLTASKAWTDRWSKLLEELKYMVCRTPIGHFWSREAFGTRRIQYERCTLLVAVESIKTSMVDRLQ